MGRKFKADKDWTRFPIRHASKRFYDCALCPVKIQVGERYYDAGNGVRVHLRCGEAHRKVVER